MELVYLKKINLKKLFLIGFAILLLLETILIVKIPTAIHAESSKKVIRFTTHKSVDFMKEYVKGFERQHPDVEVEVNCLDDYSNKLRDEIYNNTAPDVMFIPEGLSLNDIQHFFMKIGRQSKLEDKYNYLDQAVKINDDVYGLPSSMYLAGFVYNKKVFEKAGITKLPTSIKDFLKDMSYIKKNTGKIPFYSGYSSIWGLNIWEYFSFIEMTGDEKYLNKDFTNIVNPFGIGSTHEKVYSFYYNLIKNNYCEDSIKDYSWNQAIRDLGNGNLGCMAVGSWAVSTVQDVSTNPNDIGYMPFPNKINKQQYASIIADYCIGISRNTKYPELAKEFVEYFLDESNYNSDMQCISIVKGREIPEIYKAIKNLHILQNSTVSDNLQQQFNILEKRLNMYSGMEQKRIIESAVGLSSEKLYDIYNDWNRRWEKSRTEEMKKNSGKSIFSFQSDNITQHSLDLTYEEKKFLKKRPIIKVGLLRESPPFSYIEKNKIKGMSKLVADDIFKKIKVKCKFVIFDDEMKMTKALDNNQIDLIMGLEDTEENKEKYQMTKPYIEYNNVVIRNKMSDNIKKLNLAKAKAAIVENSSCDYYRGVDKKYKCTSVESAMKSVDMGLSQYTITNYYLANYYIKNDQFDNLEVVATSSKNSLRIAFRSDEDARMISGFNKCLYDISDNSLASYLVEANENEITKVTLKMLLKQYPVHFIIGILFVYIIVLVEIWFSGYEKQKYLHKQEFYAKRYALLAEMMDEYIFEYDVSDGVLTIDEKFKDFFGCLKNKIELNNIEEKNAKLNQFIEVLKHMVQNEEKEKRMYFGNMRDQDVTWVRIFLSPIENEETHKILYIGKISNVQNEMEERQEFLKKTALDSLTKVYNRLGFNKIYADQFSSNCKYRQSVVGILDYDNFKSVNDTLGHLGGDKALKMLANEIKKIFGDLAIFARYGGDEFIFYIPDGRNVEKIKKMLLNLVHTMDTYINYEDNTVKVSISIGAVIVSSKMDINEAFDLADQELYKVKGSKKNSYSLKNYYKRIYEV